MTWCPVDLLERLAREDPAVSEYCPRVPAALWDADWGEAELTALEAERARQYGSLVREVAVAWGPPAFEGGRGEPGFPGWCKAVRLAYWRRGGRLAYVAYRYADRGCPLQIVFGAVREREGQERCTS